MNMVRLDLRSGAARPDGFAASVLLEHDQMKVRRIELAAGARIPPCEMQEDVVFVVVTGRITFRTEGEQELVVPPGAVFIPGGATTRSMEAHEDSIVLAVLCRCEAASLCNEGDPTKP